MGTGLNKVILYGNLGADPELRSSSGERSVLKIRLATSEVWFDKEGTKKESTEWHAVTVFGNRAEPLSRLLKKGDRVLVEGKLHTSSYEKEGQKHYFTEIIAWDVWLAGGGKPSGATANGAFTRPAPSAAVPDDVPF